MSARKVRTFQALVKIRLRRQETLDEVTANAQRELKRVSQAVKDASTAVSAADEEVSQQIARIDLMTALGSRFQIGRYLEQQDYLVTLIQEAQQRQSEEANALASMEAQTGILKRARAAAARNAAQHEKLAEKLKKTLQAIDCAQLDAQDEEAEEAIIARIRRQNQQMSEALLTDDHV